MDFLEKAFSENLQQNFDITPLNAEARKYLQELSIQQKSDFTPTEGFFSNESKEHIARESADRLAKALAARYGEVGLPQIRQEWQKIVVDFHQAGYWGQIIQNQRPAKILSEDQKRTRAMIPYIWIAFQALILMKTVVSYFGQQAADSDETSWSLYLALAFSFGSLVLFAWLRMRKGD